MTILKKIEPVENKRKFPRKYIILATLSLLVLTVVEIWASNTVVAFGEKYEKLSSLEKNLQIENQLLENEIATFSSLKTIASKSAELGFSKLQSIQYIR